MVGDLTQVSAEQLGGRFDYIDCVGVLHHLEQPGAALAHLRGLLLPGGGMAIGVYGEVARRPLRLVQHALSALLGAPARSSPATAGTAHGHTTGGVEASAEREPVLVVTGGDTCGEVEHGGRSGGRCGGSGGSGGGSDDGDVDAVRVRAPSCPVPSAQPPAPACRSHRGFTPVARSPAEPTLSAAATGSNMAAARALLGALPTSHFLHAMPVRRSAAACAGLSSPSLDCSTQRVCEASTSGTRCHACYPYRATRRSPTRCCPALSTRSRCPSCSTW